MGKRNGKSIKRACWFSLSGKREFTWWSEATVWGDCLAFTGADVLSNLDIDLIEMTAYAIYRMRQARQSLDQEGLLIQQGDKLIKNPAANIEKDYQKIFGKVAFNLD